MDGKDGDTSVAKDTALFHLWIILREAGTWGYFHGCLPHSIFLPEEIWSFDQLRLTEIFGRTPLEASSAGLDFVSTYLHCFTADFS